MYKYVTTPQVNEFDDLLSQMDAPTLYKYFSAIEELKRQESELVDRLFVLPAPCPTGEKKWTLWYSFQAKAFYLTETELSFGQMTGFKIERETETIRLTATATESVLHEAWARAFEFRD